MIFTSEKKNLKYEGFCRGVLPNSKILAYVSINGEADLWTLDNTKEAVIELVDYYKSEWNIPLTKESIKIFKLMK